MTDWNDPESIRQAELETRRRDRQAQMLMARWDDVFRYHSEAIKGYTAAQCEAFRRGLRDGQITGQDSLEVITPYDTDTPLYEAWQAGYDAA